MAGAKVDPDSYDMVDGIEGCLFSHYGYPARDAAGLLFQSFVPRSRFHHNDIS